MFILHRVITFFCILIGFQSAFSQSKNYIQQAQQYIHLGDSLTDASEPLKGLAYYKRAEKLFVENKDIERQTYMYRYLVRHLDIAGKYQEAANELKKGLFLLENKCKTKPDSTAFWIYSKLGAEYQRLEKFDSCNVFYEKTNAILKRNSTVSNRGVCFFFANVGSYEMSFGNYDLAHDFYVKSLSVIDKDKQLEEFRGTILANFVRCLTLENQNDLALKYSNQLLEINKESPTRYNQILLIAIANYDRKDYGNARKYLSEAYKIYSVQKSKSSQNENLDFEKMYFDTLAGILFKTGDFNKAEVALQRSLSLTKKLYGEKGYDIAENYRFMGRVKLKQNKISESLGFIQKAIVASHLRFASNDIYDNPPLVNIAYNWVMFRALDAKSEALFERYKISKQGKDLKKALETAELALELASKIRKTYQSPNQKASFTEYFYPFYSRNLEISNAVYQLEGNANSFESAFNFAEKMKAAALADKQNDNAIKPKNVSQTFIDKEKNLQQKINTAESNMIATADSTELVKWQTQLANYTLELNDLLKTIETQSPNYVQLKYKSDKVKVPEIQAQLSFKEAALVSYSLIDETILTYVLTDGKSMIYRQKVESDFTKKINDFRIILTQSPKGKKYNGQTLSSELYKVLIEPIEKEIFGKKRLIIIRDAELNYLPFEVLAKQKEDYLLKKYTISYAYSASLLIASKNEKKAKSNGLLAFAPFSSGRFQDAPFRDKNLGALPKSEEEVEKIGGDFYLENDATKKRFYEKYRDKNIIHFATHAITDDADPLKSFIAFYPENTDYKLFTNELYDLDLQNTQLVMLSACETGVGKLQKGEGVMSLARAFTYAGANAIITTLWNAHDEASAYISERFYAHLKDGFKTDEALQKAKLDFLESELAARYDHPYFWANFILIGSAESIDFGVNWWVWGIVLVFIVAVIYYFRKRKVTKP